MPLNQKLELYLKSNNKPTTYSKLAKMFDTSPRGIGSAAAALGRRGFRKLSDLIGFTKDDN